MVSCKIICYLLYNSSTCDCQIVRNYKGNWTSEMSYYDDVDFYLRF